MFRSLAIVIVVAVFVSVGAERWREAGKSTGAPVAPAEAGGLLLEGLMAEEASVGESEEPKLTSPPPNGLCHVHEAPLHQRRPQEFLRATEDAPAKVRAVKFPRAPFTLIPKRVVRYERPRIWGFCSVISGLEPPKVFDCAACVEAQKEWFREHPAPEQVVVRIPGDEPSPWGNGSGGSVPNPRIRF